MPFYHHSPLPLDSIRLLRLLPHNGYETSPVKCQLSACPLLDSKTAHVFDALSYVWGSGDTPYIILIDNREYRVGANLHAALLHLRDGFVDRVLWIDAICIDQTNMAEKGQQVHAMAKIYAKAGRVIVWLGEEVANSDQALEAIRMSANSHSTAPVVDETTKQAILDLLGRPWFQRIWVLQEAAAARHVLVKCGTAEIDGYAFGSGRDALKSLYDDDPNLRGLVPPIADLIRNSAFRPRYDSMPIQRGRFTLSIRPLAELADLFHTRLATVAADKVYALLGMSSDNATAAGLSADYNMSWAAVFANLVTFSLSRDVSVETWDDKEVAVIRGKGRVLGRVSKVDGSEITWKETKASRKIPFKLEVSKSERRSFSTPVSSKPIRPGDVICLLQGASSPTIIRLHTDYSTIIRIAVSSIMDGSKVGDAAASQCLPSKTAFPDSFMLVWDWHTSREPAKEYKDFKMGQGLPAQTTQSREDLDMATRWWAMGRLLEPVDQTGAQEHMEKSLGLGNTALGGAEGYWESNHAIWEEWGDLLAQERDGWVALAYAAEKGYQGVVWLILRHGGSPEAQDQEWGKTAMSWAAANGHEGIVRQLLQKGAAADTPSRYYSTTPLILAAKNGHEGVVRLLLDNGAAVDARCEHRCTYEEIRLRRILKGVEGDVDTQDADCGMTPLLMACTHGHERVVRLLLERGAEIELGNRLFQSPLFRAAEGGHEGIVLHLVEKGAMVKVTDPDRRTPLHQAAMNGHGGIVQLLLENGAVVQARDIPSWTPLLEAREHGHDAIVRQLQAARVAVAKLETETSPKASKPKESTCCVI